MQEILIEKNNEGLINIYQSGMIFNCNAGISIVDFLHQFGITYEYIESKIRTVFVNGSPADDLETARLNDADTLSLSGAMPGLVGIALGRNTPIAGFRADISLKESDIDYKGKAQITLKLFNFIATECGIKFLKHGFMIKASEAIETLKINLPETKSDKLIFIKLKK